MSARGGYLLPLVVVVAAVLCGCSGRPPVPSERQYKIVGIPVAPSDTSYTWAVRWGLLERERDTAVGWGETARRPEGDVSAEIRSVGVEYFPTVGARAPYPKAKSASDTTYTIASTVHYRVMVHDSVEYWRNPGAYKADIIIEAITEGETVMEERTMAAAIAPGDVTVSVKWSGLAVPEMDRIRYVRARWKYGR